MNFTALKIRSQFVSARKGRGVLLTIKGSGVDSG